MPLTRRAFVTTGLAGAAGIWAHGTAWALETPWQAPGEDGSRLWLRYAPPGPAADAYRLAIRQVIVQSGSPTAQIIRNELRTGLSSLLGTPMAVSQQSVGEYALVAGSPERSGAIQRLGWNAELDALGDEGYIIRSTRVADRPLLAIASRTETGALYGAFHLLRLMQTGQPIDRLDLSERPRLQLRLLNHWDNLTGTIERGYAGNSLWQWNELPGTLSPRYAEYARANASIGVNGTVINNVNADVRLLSPEYLLKVAALAGVFRPYGVRVYLSANVAAPIRLGGLATADPLDQGVVSWWKTKAAEIYKLIPDFGGFLVKANSEGQPGPKDYGRTHAEGANVLADALSPHGGRVIWRAFIYDDDVDADRSKRAYLEFMKLDGQFRPNVVVQVKNGPIDFQPREPFHPLFGAMKRTPVIAEIQATQEYLGQAQHLVYLGPMWEEFLSADTFAKGKGSTVARCLDGSVEPYAVTGMASVANPGLDTNWCGHHFSQANWYASGRLAWNPSLPAARIAEEWTRMTFTNDPAAVGVIRDLMMGSREAFVNYTMPLGLHHLIGGNHYAPMPQNGKAPRADWTATYYHQASADGIGFDRTSRGSNAVGQYFPPVRDMFERLATCPEPFLLWFHRCPWDYKMKSGKTLWTALCEKYAEGARQAAAMQTTWESLRPHVDPRRHTEVAARLAIQVADAARWRDEILAYFQGFSKKPIGFP